jgi:hypothetical protein
MYSKLFSSLLTSSVWDTDIETRVVWITLLALKDQDGFARVATVDGLARLARVSVEGARKAVEILTSPDPESSDPEHEGRRIERAPGGWVVLNAKKYDELGSEQHRREKNAEYVRKHRERKREESECKGAVSTCKQVKAYIDTDIDISTGTPESTMPSLAEKPEPEAPKGEPKQPDAPDSADVTAAFEAYRQAIQPRARFLPAARDKIKRRLDTYTLPELLQAVSNFAADAWYMANNAHRGAAWFYHSDDRIEQFVNLVPRTGTDTRKDNEHGSNGRHQREPAEGHRVSALTGFSRRLD